MKYRSIMEHREEFSVRMMCRLLQEQPTGFDGWQRRPLSQRSRVDEVHRCRIERIHSVSDGVYGSRKIRDEAWTQGSKLRRRLITRLMAASGLKGCLKKRYRVTTHSRHGYLTPLDELNQDVTACRPNQHRVADTNNIRTDEGWLYLAAVKEPFIGTIF